jgi:hypothetical protein
LGVVLELGEANQISVESVCCFTLKTSEFDTAEICGGGLYCHSMLRGSLPRKWGEVILTSISVYSIVALTSEICLLDFKA